MNPLDAVANFAYGVVTVAPSPADSGTSLSMATADADLFPDPSTQAYNIVVFPSNAAPISTNAEIVRVTAKGSPSGGNVAFTITREQESTTARTIVVGDRVALMPTAKTITDIGNSLTLLQGQSEGVLINGKLSVSVASNNLTVAIKTLAGNDPSASDPVYVRIVDTVHVLTAALSVTKNAGTNWCALGDAKIATNEVDLFAYIGYNATDGVVLGFSRICHALKYGDFSTTSTNDRYAAISTISNATSTDKYRVIGRFNAVLSATASFNWSIPATQIVISRPIFETRRLTYTNVYTGWASVTGTVYYQIVGSRCHLFTTEAIGGTSNATTKTMKLPISIGITGTDFSWVGAFIQDNTSWQQYPGHVRIENGSPDVVKVGKTVHLSAWTASGTATFGLMGFMYPL